MNREETLALYEQGVEAWNKWANEMLEERKRLEEAGEWLNQNNEFSNLNPKNSKTQSWVTNAEANFSKKSTPNKFEDEVDFSCFIFPGNTYFEDANFSKNANFKDCQFTELATFKNCSFIGEATFYHSSFEGEIIFSASKFERYTRFDSVKFKNVASFINTNFYDEVAFLDTIFTNDTWFNRTKFNDYVSFENTEFYGNAEFENITFIENANFENANFKKQAIFNGINFLEYVWFNNAIFKGQTTFKDTKFNKLAFFVSTLFKGITSFSKVSFHDEADFNAISSQSAFLLEHAKFYKNIPNFIQANFKEAPRLDNIELGDDVSPGSFKNSITTFIHPDIKVRYQALKRLAIQAHDHENEQRFWAGELRSDRSLRTEDNGWNLRPLVSAFWWGNIAYGFFSDYGRSIVRPLISLFILLCIMTNIHLFAHNSNKDNQVSKLRTKTHITKQSDLKDCNIRSSAFRVAAKNGAIGLLQNPAKRSTFVRDYTCLYGTYNDNITPKIPNSIFWIELLHTLFSAILIFLALLGIRNNFKLK